MDFKKHLEAAWNLTIKHIVNLVLMTLVTLVVSFVTLGFLAPVVMAGYIHAIIMMVRNDREPKMEDLFSHMSLFLPLLGFSTTAATSGKRHRCLMASIPGSPQ